jgi:nucleotidyltransferase substrate binding protein (TIGR01987 family)
MSKLEALKKQYVQALATLEDVLGRTPDIGEETIYRDSAIQRFEFCFDLAWKYIKELLRDVHGIECASPKGCLREAFTQRLITEESVWLEMTEMRNLASHTYNEETAQKIFFELPRVLVVLKNLAQ